MGNGIRLTQRRPYLQSFRILVVGLLLPLFSGCVLTQGPVPVPDASVPPTYIRENQLAFSDARVDWRNFFSDPKLRELITLALENNRNLRIAVQRVAEARAIYGIQKSASLPSISAIAADNRARTPADLSITGVETTASSYQVALGLSSWELDFWGRVSNLKKAALESYLATDAARKAIQVSLVAQVANTYLVQCELTERLAIAKQTLKTRENSLQIMQRRYATGAASKLDLIQAELLLNQVRDELVTVQQYLERNHNALTLLVGKPVKDIGQPLSQIEADLSKSIATGLPSDLLIYRPDILAAEHQLEAAHANVNAARAAFFPRITLTGSAGTASASLDGLFRAGSQAWTFVPSITLPIFDAGLNQANLDLAKARQQAAVSDYERTIQGAFREVSDALADRYWLSKQVTVRQENLAMQTERARLALLRYQNGAASYLDVLDAERNKFSAEQLLVQTRRELLASTVSVYAALGGGAGPQYP